MDSKRVYRKISTIFWFLLAILPIIICLFGYLFGFFIHTDGLTSSSDILNVTNSLTFRSYLNNYNSLFTEMTPPFINVMFNNLFNSFSIGYTARQPLVMIFSWFVWVYFIELMCDFVIWLPKMCHDWMIKCGG